MVYLHFPRKFIPLVMTYIMEKFSLMTNGALHRVFFSPKGV